MKTTSSIFRVVLIMIIAFTLIELLTDTTAQWAIIDQPVLILVLAVILLFAIALEISLATLHTLMFHSLNDEAKERYLKKESSRDLFAWINKHYLKLVDAKPIEEEHEIILDHDYDGIKELDNNLPPWWVWGFYATIVFAIVYMARYHIFDGVSQDEEYRIEVAKANEEIQEYRKTAKGLVDASTVVVLTSVDDLRAGENIFSNSCAVCHRADGGGGIGPNLTDNYWILGGEISDVFQVISEGGRPGKGMIAWKQDLNPLQIAQVSSYILSLQDTNPPDAKEPEGELFVSSLPTGETENPTTNTEDTDLEELLDKDKDKDKD